MERDCVNQSEPKAALQTMSIKEPVLIVLCGVFAMISIAGTALFLAGHEATAQEVTICATNHRNEEQRCDCVNQSEPKAAGCRDGKKEYDPRDGKGMAVCKRHCNHNLCSCCRT